MNFLKRIFKSGLSKTDKGLDKHEPIVMTLPSMEVADLVAREFRQLMEEDGFTVNQMDQVKKHYLFRKDKAAISINRDEANLVFRCEQRDIPFIHTAVIEALADIERMAKAIRQSIDRKSFANVAQTSVKDADKGLSLEMMLFPEILIPSLKGTNKSEIIDELLEVLRRNALLTDLKIAKKDVWTRENSVSTGMQYGVALPHARTTAVTQVLCAIGIKREGVDWESIDGQPTNIIVLVLSPLGVIGPHVRLLSVISQKLNKDGREALLKCDTALDMYFSLKN